MQSTVGDKMMFFDRIPDKCDVCQKPFNKKDKQQVSTWFVTVRADKKTVHLFCPDCMAKTQRILEPLVGDGKGIKEATLTEDGKLEIKSEQSEPVEVNMFSVPVEVPVENS